jgi:hypothetical protein
MHPIIFFLLAFLASKHGTMIHGNCESCVSAEGCSFILKRIYLPSVWCNIRCTCTSVLPLITERDLARFNRDKKVIRSEIIKHFSLSVMVMAKSATKENALYESTINPITTTTTTTTTTQRPTTTTATTIKTPIPYITTIATTRTTVSTPRPKYHLPSYSSQQPTLREGQKTNGTKTPYPALRSRQ